jgi:hypothetical protein
MPDLYCDRPRFILGGPLHKRIQLRRQINRQLAHLNRLLIELSHDAKNRVSSQRTVLRMTQYYGNVLVMTTTPVGTFTDYNSFVELLRARKAALGLSNDVMDELAGWRPVTAIS